jgi:superfamily II DNA or RNA helicase
MELVKKNEKYNLGVSGIISLPTGYGKTILGVNLIC